MCYNYTQFEQCKNFLISDIVGGEKLTHIKRKKEKLMFTLDETVVFNFFR